MLMLSNCRKSCAIIAVILTIVVGVSGVANPIYGNSYTCTSTNPSQPCTAYCSYSITTTHILSQQCSTYQTRNGNCQKCDQLLFTRVGTFCVPHLFNNQQQFAYYNFRSGTAMTTGDRRLGWYTGTTTVDNTEARYLVTGIPAHYAIRIRFGVYLINYHDSYYYPLRYTMDTTTYTYTQTSQSYFSCWDIITSPKIEHFGVNLTVTWLNTNTTTRPLNYRSCTFCRCGTCGAGCCCGCGGDANNCCDDKYIQIRDMIVFISPCPTGCSACQSTSTCITCSGGYVLNDADKLCYTACPQATYAASFLIGEAPTNSYVGYTGNYQTRCTTCPSTCLQCSSSTRCSRCYTVGRNQSYLLNNTCYQSTCPFGYFANMTNHTCDCPEEYHWASVSFNNITMNCYDCAFQCLRCYGSLNYQCRECRPGFFLANNTNICLTRCPDGQFQNSVDQVCSLCQVSCSACQGHSQNCTSCHTNSNRYLLGNACVLSCPNGYSWNNETLTCDICDFYTYSYLGACITVCPVMYEHNQDNRSCIHLGQTQFYFQLLLQQAHVVSHGKLLKFTIMVEDGLNTSTENYLKTRSYYDVQLIYKDSRLQQFEGVRSLVNISLPIRNIAYSGNRLTYYTNLPDSIDYHKSFQIIFPVTFMSSQNIKYNNFTTVYSVNQHPQLLKEYYSYTIRNYYNLFAIPFLLLITFLFLIQIKGVFQIYIQTVRIVQILGLLIYTAFPIGSRAYYFLIGCSYLNLDFIPNLYAMLAKADSSAVFASYFLSSQDMDFVRLMGSIIFFSVFILMVYIICKYLFNVKQSKLSFMIQLSIDLMQVKVFHSFWSSLLYIIANYRATQFSMFIVFILAIAFLSGIVGRRYSLWKQTKEYSPFFFWRAAATLIVCFISLANQLVLCVLVLVCVATTLWQFFLLHSDKYKVSINNLNSQNYMEESTYKVLNNYDVQVGYSFAISIRNTIATVCPFVTSLLVGVMVLLRDAETYSIFFTVIIIYIFFLLVCTTTVLIFKFLQERRRYLVQNKLSYLQKKYARLGDRENDLYEQRKRPRVVDGSHFNLDDQKFLQGGVNRSVLKTFD